MADIRVIDIQQETEIKAGRARVFQAIAAETSNWCGPPFVHSDESVDLIMERFVGGRFYEPLADGKQGYLWGTIATYVEGSCLEICGTLGMSGAIIGRVTYELVDCNGGTKLKLRHQAMGQISDDVVGSFSWGWKQLIERRLKNFVEKGEVLGMKALTLKK